MRNFTYLLFSFLFFLSYSISGQTLTCNSVIGVALGDDGFSNITPQMVLAGGPYDFQSLIVEPSSVSSSDIGIQQYLVTEPSTGNVCWGALEVSNEPGEPLACRNLVHLVLDDMGVAELTLGNVLLNGSFDYSDFTISPSIITAADSSKGVYTITDGVNGNSCWGSYLVINNSISNGALTCKDQVNVSVGPFICEAKITPDLILADGPYNFSVIEVSESSLPVGEHTVIVTDTLNNTSCFGTVKVEDKTPPIAIANQDIVLGITPNNAPFVMLFPIQVDNGSFDQCSEVIFSPPYWVFDCSDLGINEVTLIVTDEAGNSNSAIAEVEVIFDGAVTLTCTDEVIVSCSDAFSDINRPITSPDFCTEAVQSVDELEIDIDGDGTLSEILGPNGIMYSESTSSCQNFVFKRTWSLNGESCSQTIYVNYEDTWDSNSIVWPENQMIDCIENDLEPTWDTTCDMVTFSVESDTIGLSLDACIEITNTYSIINWCLFDSSNPLADGIYSNTNVLSYLETTKPVLTVPVDITINGAQPDGVSFQALVESECAGLEYSWSVAIDLNSDWTFDMEWRSDLPTDLGTTQSPLWDDDDGNGVPDVRVGNPVSVDNLTRPQSLANENYEINLPFQYFDFPLNEVHRIEWRVIDACGNFTTSTSFFTLSDLIAVESPVARCFKVIALIPFDQNFTTVRAIDFNSGSFDNTTTEENLRFTFTDVPPELDPDYDESIRSSVKTFTILDVGEFTEDIYVWDEDGNFGVCSNQLSIRNPFGISDVAFVIPNLISETGESICIPIHVENFNCISSVDGSVHWDASILEYTNVVNVNLPDASSQNFNTVETSDGRISFSWFDFSVSIGATIPNDVPLFELCFDVIGERGTQSSVKLESTPTPISVSGITDKNNPTAPAQMLDFVVSNGSVIVGDILCQLSSIASPLNLIELNIGGVNEDNVLQFISPNRLASDFGFSDSDVSPSFSSSCPFIMSFEDEITQMPNGDITVIRLWRILNLEDGAIYIYQQIIRVTNTNNFICDILPNDAPIGDCDSGHTDSDDVEWPADIIISDHRIAPTELVAYSGVMVKNSMPIFFNTPDLYSATYEDLLDSLSQNLLFIERLWTARREGVNQLWSYNQSIVIDLEMLVGLVSTNTITNRAIPNVIVTDLISTDQEGLANFDSNDELALELIDALDNGLTIRDWVLTRKHLLDEEDFSDLQVLAADYDGSGGVSTTDLVALQRAMLGIPNENTIGWRFYNKNDLSQLDDNTTLVIGKTQSYIGIKPGDVDDDAVLNDVMPAYKEAAISYEDQLINSGQVYNVPVKLEQAAKLYGIELSYEFDSQKFDIESITTDAFDVTPQYFLSDNLLRIIITDASVASQLIDGDELLTLTLLAKENTILSQGFTLSEEKNSLSLTDEMELNRLVEEVEGLITTSVLDQSTLKLTTFPNPVSEVVYIEGDELDSGQDLSLIHI